ncbi:MAG: (2Fe-2S)-binding protein [Bacteriovoracaceae bacterium]|nr:(2Fe-2S)-binding protein [Bacteriovoracaceae bacterium]
MKTTFILNGEKRILNFEPNVTLADSLRDVAGMKSVKIGCNRGDCGTCTIIMNGNAVKSCLILSSEAEGAEIMTLEGLCKDGKLSRLQENMISHNSFQCGFCAPGMIMAATELLEKYPNPSEEEIKEGIAGNLCRCTGYTPIIEAIDITAKEGK